MLSRRKFLFLTERGKPRSPGVGRRSPTHPRGLTFLEIEMALLLLLLGVLAVIEISPLAMQGVRLAEQHAMAGQIAQHILESEMAKSYDTQLALLPGGANQTGNVTPNAPAAGEKQVPGATLGMYTYRILRGKHPNPSLKDSLLAITVEIWWRDPNARRYNRTTADRVVRLVGYKTRPLK